jgi:hypothetical protein
MHEGRTSHQVEHHHMNHKVVPFPVLTMEAMSGPSWEPALTLRLPSNPSFELLLEARRQVVEYLDWYSKDPAVFGPAEEVRIEINRGAARLVEICLALGSMFNGNLLHEPPPLDDAKLTQLENAFIKDMWTLIFADDPAIITQLERRLGTTRQQAVDEMIEATGWSQHLPDYTGHRGSATERLNALRSAYLVSGAT